MFSFIESKELNDYLFEKCGLKEDGNVKDCRGSGAPKTCPNMSFEFGEIGRVYLSNALREDLWLDGTQIYLAEDENGKPCMVKIGAPSLWEYYISKMVHSRVGEYMVSRV